MSITFKSPVGILNICELILTNSCGGLMSGVPLSYTSTYRAQFIISVIFGSFFIDIVNVVSIFSAKSIDRYIRLLIAGFGSILWLCASALLLASTNDVCAFTGKFAELCDYIDISRTESLTQVRTIVAGIFGLASFVVRGVDGFFVYKGMKS